MKHLGYVQEAKMLGIYLAFPLMHVWPLPHAALIRMRSEMVMLSSLACLSKAVPSLLSLIQAAYCCLLKYATTTIGNIGEGSSQNAAA